MPIATKEFGDHPGPAAMHHKDIKGLAFKQFA